MPNPAYEKGVRKERAFVNQARRAGNLALRSAGSHSPIDVVIIDRQRKIVRLIQCKPDNITPAHRERILKEINIPEGMYKVEVGVQ